MSKAKYLDQLSIFIENRTGELLNITSLLKRENISILSIVLSDSSEFGILRLLTKNTQKAKDILFKNGIVAQNIKVIGVKIADQVGSFNEIVKILSDADIDIRYTYTVNEKNDGIFVFKVDDEKIEKASLLLEQNGVKTMNENDL
jgi:hypothetical protein